MVSTKFMKGHPKAGSNTDFSSKIINEIKRHTIRGNYQYWKNIADKINKGEGYLSLRCWSEKPYRSKQVDFAEYSEIRVEPLTFKKNADGSKAIIKIKDKIFTGADLEKIAKNDGFDNVQDLIDWFPEKFSGCIIHFLPNDY